MLNANASFEKSVLINIRFANEAGDFVQISERISFKIFSSISQSRHIGELLCFLASFISSLDELTAVRELCAFS